MMSFKKKIFSLLVLIFGIVFGAAALPGFKPYLSDLPGDFVYYRDYTFKTESYVGFLYYGNSAYAARYYAPENKKEGKPEKSVMILFTVDEAKEHMDLTGEKVLSGANQEDYEIVNYLHDLVYELNSRRIKAGKVDGTTSVYDSKDTVHSGVIKSETYEQFGGDVRVVYDYTVPLFNVKLIENYGNEPQLQIAVTGRITASENNSFDGFKGFSSGISEKSNVKLDRKSKKNKTEFEKTSIELDSQWQQKMENMWVQDENAVLCLIKIPAQSVNLDFILRQSMIFLDNSYYDWQSVKIQKNENGFTIEGRIFESGGKRDKRHIFKVLEEKSSGKAEYFMLSCSVFDSVYRNNVRYFNSLIDSFKIKAN